MIICKNCGKDFKRLIYGDKEPWKIYKPEMKLHIICGDCGFTSNFRFVDGEICNMRNQK